MPADQGVKNHKDINQSKPVETKPDEKSLEYWLTRATDPYIGDSNRPEYVKGFCEQVNEELEGPQIACRLLAHKIQSPYEVEALHGLSVLDACVKNCGMRFHNEIGKFRFLNEIIKMLSPKYMGSQTNERVKQKAIELLYSWKQTMKHLQKVQQAYTMLREQGVISQDPIYMDELLAALLRSKNPDDLQTANRLIKSMVKAEDQKIEKISKRSEDLQAASNNALLLSEMVSQFDFTLSSAQDMEIMKELLDSLLKFRPTLFRYAGEAAEGQEEALGEVLRINDDVSRAVDDYRAKVEPHMNALFVQGKADAPQYDRTKNSVLLSSLLNFDAHPPVSAPGDLVTPDRPSCSSELSITSDDIGILGATGTPLMMRKKQQERELNSEVSAVNEVEELLGKHLSDHSGALSQKPPPPSDLPQQLLGCNQERLANSLKSPVAGTAAKMQEEDRKQKKGLFDLDELSQSLIKQNLPTNTVTVSDVQKITEQRQKIPMRDLPRQSTAPPSMSPLDPYAHPSGVLTVIQQNSVESAAESASTSGPSSPNKVVESKSTSGACSGGALVDLESDKAIVSSSSTDEAENSKDLTPPSLEDVIVSVEDIEPGTSSPVSILSREQIKVILHYAANRPKPGIITTVISVTSSSTQPMTDIRFEAKTDRKDVCMKLQRPSCDRLPAFNPIFPQSAVSQVMLLGVANYNENSKICLDYTLIYCVGQDARSSHSVSGCFEVEYTTDL